jgi:hypothetical protein
MLPLRVFRFCVDYCFRFFPSNPNPTPEESQLPLRESVTWRLVLSKLNHVPAEQVDFASFQKNDDLPEMKVRLAARAQTKGRSSNIVTM